MPNLNNPSGLKAAFEDHMTSLYFEGYTDTLSSEDYEFFFNEFINA